MLASGSSVDDVVAVLAYAIGDAFPAAPHCRRLLTEREELSLPELPDVVAPSVLAPPREVSAEIREQRKNRREEEKRRKKTSTPTRSQRAARPKNVTPPRTESGSATPPPVPVPETRRRVLLDASRRGDFNADHSLVGTVVMANVTFDAQDPENPSSRRRSGPHLSSPPRRTPCSYGRSIPKTHRPDHVFGPCRRVGLDHVSYIDDAHVIVAVEAPEALHRLGVVTTVEWNSLF